MFCEPALASVAGLALEPVDQIDDVIAEGEVGCDNDRGAFVEAVEQRGGHLGIAEHAGPFA